MTNKPYLILLSCFLVIILIACTSTVSPPALNDDQAKVVASATIPPTTTLISTQTPVSVTTANTEWITHTIDLYSLQLKLPADWTITETDRRPESQEDWAIQFGHDCAKYILANGDETITITLEPGCGLLEGAGFPCPPNTVIIDSSIYDQTHIVRYGIPNSNYYGYTEADTELAFCADSDKISFIDNDIESYILIEFNDNGDEATRPQRLKITDEIIRSIGSIP